MNLDLQIKDNFLPKDLFDKLSVYCRTLKYDNEIKYKTDDKIYDEHFFLYKSNF